MSNLRRAWTNDKYVSDKAAQSFIQYLRGHSGDIVNVGNYVFDSFSLKKQICLSKCFSCLKYQSENCCCGNSYSMPKEFCKRLFDEYSEIIKLIPDIQLDKSRFNALTTFGATSTSGQVNGWCGFSYFDEGDKAQKCAIHAYCLRSGLNPFDYKPPACSLFPIEGIIMPNGNTVVFCSCKETSNFTMFFYTLSRRPCVNIETFERVLSSDMRFSKYLRTLRRDNILADKEELIRAYRPAYIEQERVLRYFLGDDVYSRLRDIIEGRG